MLDPDPKCLIRILKIVGVQETEESLERLGWKVDQQLSVQAGETMVPVPTNLKG